MVLIEQYDWTDMRKLKASDNPEGIVQVMKSAISEVVRREFRFEPDRQKISQYSRPLLTKKLASVFDQVIARK